MNYSHVPFPGGVKEDTPIRVVWQYLVDLGEDELAACFAADIDRLIKEAIGPVWHEPTIADLLRGYILPTGECPCKTADWRDWECVRCHATFCDRCVGGRLFWTKDEKILLCTRCRPRRPDSKPANYFIKD